MAKFDDENCLISNVPPKKFLQNIDIIKRLEKNICEEYISRNVFSSQRVPHKN